MDPRIFTVLDFWFAEGREKQWFASDPAFDAEVRETLLPLYEAAVAGGLSDWQETPEGSTALVILLDQVPRNVFRGEGRAFATDDLALEIAKRAIALDFEKALRDDLRTFLYMPFMHAENLPTQKVAVGLYEIWGGAPTSTEYAHRHMAVIERFGRFPARNKALGRTSTDAEIKFLKDHPSGF